MNEENRELALDLLQVKAETYRESLGTIHWVTEDGSSLDGDYCEDCIGFAVKQIKNAHRKQRKAIYRKYQLLIEKGIWNGNEVREKFHSDLTDAEFKRKALGSRTYELKEYGAKPRFDCEHTFGGYESDGFRFCDICGRGLDVCILPDMQSVEEVISTINDYGISDDATAYEAYELISHAWRDKKHKAVDELTEQLIDKVIDILKEEL